MDYYNDSGDRRSPRSSYGSGGSRSSYGSGGSRSSYGSGGSRSSYGSGSSRSSYGSGSSRSSYGERSSRSSHGSSGSRSYGEGGSRSSDGERRSSGDGGRRPRKKRRSTGRTLLLVLLYLVAVGGLSVLLACVGWVMAGDVLALNKEYKEVVFTITQEDDFSSVADRMKEEGLVEYEFLFNIFAKVTHKTDTMAVGTYTLNTDMDYRALLAGVQANSSTRAQVKVVIPEGYTIDQVFDLMVEQGVVSDVEELRQAAATHDYAFDFLQDIPLGDYHRLEGYLMPATYDFYTPHDPVYAINKLLVYFSEQVGDDVLKQVEDSGYTLREVLTIASMIERETTGDDREDISGVIRNRLNSSEGGTMGFLQIDATLVYINGGREPVEADKAIDSPYNTYLYKGLPAGPIANPGMESINAALNPSNISDFYYTLGDDDTHHFFRTYDQMQAFMATQERYNKS